MNYLEARTMVKYTGELSILTTGLKGKASGCPRIS